MELEALLDTILFDALKRKPQKLTLDTNYSHINLSEWIKSILPEWDILVPQQPQQQLLALSEWPTTEDSRTEVINWLTENNYSNAEDLLDGACEPLAYYLSSQVKDSLLVGTFVDSFTIMLACKMELETINQRNAAALVFGNCLNSQLSAPTFWGPEFQGHYKDYLFGTEMTKTNIIKGASSLLSYYIMPLYILNYIFNDDELTDKQIEDTTEETAQYSLHVVGLVFDKENRRIVVADPNGTLLPGSNMEFLTIPLKKRRAKPSTKISRFDLDCRKRKAD